MKKQTLDEAYSPPGLPINRQTVRQLLGSLTLKGTVERDFYLFYRNFLSRLVVSEEKTGNFEFLNVQTCWEF